MNNTYYIISNSTDSMETGNDFPQIQNVTKEYDPNGPNSVYKLYEHRNLNPPFVPELDSFVVRKRTKITDLQSNAFIGGRGLFLSEKFKSLLSDFNLPKHKFFKSTVIKDDDTHTYYWFHLIESDYRGKVVFEKTKFSNWKDLKLDNYQDYLDFSENEDKYGQLKANKVTLGNTFDKSLDLFMISAFDQNLYISQKLKDKIIEEKLTGIEIKSSEGKLCFEG
ncbi:MAG: hypothetical protein NVV82_12900 [Sporocytophaga sp.]|nr:hypothetical protein [Sporocytophaga sp.]